MIENQKSDQSEPKAIGVISYWKKQLYLLAEPIVILMLVTVSVVTWQISGWHKAGVIETTRAELALSKAQLDSSIENANKAIADMRDLALVLAVPILDELAADELIAGVGTTLEEDVANMLKIVSQLNKLGASEEQVANVRIRMDISVMRNLRQRTIVSLQAANKDKSSLFNHTSHMYTWSKSQFEEFVAENKLQIPHKASDSLEKLMHYKEYKKLP